MSEDNALSKAIAESTLSLFGVTVRVYMLDDGRRIFHGDDVAALFAAMESSGTPLDRAEVDGFVRSIKEVPS